MPKKERSLEYFIESRGIDNIKAVKFMKIANQLLNALYILHSVGYTHNDIKPSNIMIDSNYNVTLIDLGFTTTF